VISSTGCNNLVVVTVERTVEVKVVVVVIVDVAVCVMVEAIPSEHPVINDVQVINNVIKTKTGFFILPP
jgi:hypothetical protein